MNEKEIINGCQRGDTQAMKALYEKYYSLMLGICMRYAGNVFEAEDFVQEGFVAIFKDIRSFSNRGSFEGWLRRVMINNTLMILRKLKKDRMVDKWEENNINLATPEEDENAEMSFETQIYNADFTKEELIETMQLLPEGYRNILNLYVIDRYKHSEIAKLLGISAGTSKSQLSRARSLIKKYLYQKALEKSKQTEMSEQT
jgi:RNA polymerase sigma-70 factor (ECF subfamily)